MTWVNLDDKMPEHPKNVGLSDGAFRLHVSAICYSNRFLTDGIISADMITQLVPKYRKTYLDELLRQAVWIELVPEESYMIHDYLDWNKSRAWVLARRKASAEGGRKGAGQRWHNQ